MTQPQPIADGVWMLRTVLVNVFFVRLDADRWMLVDAGLYGSAPAIQAAAASLFGPRPPSIIVLTHGHFDHVGALHRLLEVWNAPVYAHPLELPHLNGRQPYDPPDPTVGGGLMAWMSWLYPRGPYDFGARLLALPPDGHVPEAPEWRALHTPGHTEGHVSLLRDRDQLVIAGDAVTTTKQESFVAAVLTQAPSLNGPPRYFTPDWDAARDSVRALASRHVETLASGHGQPQHGEAMRTALRDLAEHFEERARPARGYYAHGGRAPGFAAAHPVAVSAAALMVGTLVGLLFQYAGAPRRGAGPYPRAA